MRIYPLCIDYNAHKYLLHAIGFFRWLFLYRNVAEIFSRKNDFLTQRCGISNYPTKALYICISNSDDFVISAL